MAPVSGSVMIYGAAGLHRVLETWPNASSRALFPISLRAGNHPLFLPSDIMSESETENGENNSVSQGSKSRTMRSHAPKTKDVGHHCMIRRAAEGLTKKSKPGTSNCRNLRSQMSPQARISSQSDARRSNKSNKWSGVEEAQSRVIPISAPYLPS